VPELLCFRGTIKPPALEVHQPQFTITFDLSRVLDQTTRSGSASPGTLLKETKCYRYCLFPYIRAEIIESGEQTFRGREVCGDLGTTGDGIKLRVKGSVSAGMELKSEYSQHPNKKAMSREAGRTKSGWLDQWNGASTRHAWLSPLSTIVILLVCIYLW